MDETQKQTQLIEILQQGLQDEMQAALQYIALAGQHGDYEIKNDFLQYAAEELQHAQKLLGLLQRMEAPAGEMTLHLEEMGDLYLFLIEYMAKEESAIFYYDALAQLMQEPMVARLCREIQGEEQLHLRRIREIYQRVKERGIYDGAK